MNNKTEKTTNLPQSKPKNQLQSLSLTELESVAGGPEDPLCPACLNSN